MFRAHETIGALGVGVNTTTEQVVWLREEIARRGLTNALRVREADLREVDKQYDDRQHGAGTARPRNRSVKARWRALQGYIVGH